METEGSSSGGGDGAATTVSEVYDCGTASTANPTNPSQATMTTTVEVLVLDPQKAAELAIHATNHRNPLLVPAVSQSPVHLHDLQQKVNHHNLGHIGLDNMHQLPATINETVNNRNKPISIPGEVKMVRNGVNVENNEHFITTNFGGGTDVEAARCIPFVPNQANLPVLPLAVQDAASMVFDQQELHSSEDMNEKSLNGEESQVILVYQDVLTCGLCSKQFLEMTDFLEHKLEHTLGNSFYRCELCKLFFMKQTILVSHYRKRHRLPNFGDGLLLTLSRELEMDDDQPGLHGNVEHVLEGNGSMDSEGGDDHNIFRQENIIAAANEPKLVESKVGHPEFDDNNKLGLSENGNASAGCESSLGDQDGLDGDTAALPDEHGAGSQNALHLIDIKSEADNITPDRPTPPKCSIRVSLLPDATVGDTNNADSNSIDPNPEPLNPPTTNVEDDPKSTNKVKGKDFNFILLTENLRGNSYGFGKTWFKCLHCEYKTQSKAAITRHMHDRHDDMLDVHEMITVFEKQQNSQKKVMKMSAYESMREPAVVRWGSKTKAKAKRRFDRQDLPGVYPCSDCAKVFHRLRYLRKHAMVHRTDRKFLCDECGKAFKSKNLLTQHRKIHDKVKLFRCNQCDFQSRVNAAIHAHRQIHSQGSVLCDICGYAYTDKSTLSKHKRVHDVNRPFACNFPGCTWRFKTEVMCKAHIRAHTTEGKFKCSFCGYAFRHKHHLIRHESNMHGVKRTKNRTASNSIIAEEVLDSEVIDTVNLVVDPSQLQVTPDGLSEHHLVVTTDSTGTPITCTYEAADMSALNVAYHTLMQNTESQEHDEKTILLAQPDTQIVFQQE